MKPKKYVVATDNHGDQVDPETERALNSFLKDFKPEIRIHAGDCFDFRNFRKGASDDEKAHSLSDDWEAGSQFMRNFFDGGKQNVYLRGNHSFSDETEVLTRAGWKNITGVSLDDEVAEFDPTTNAVFFSNPLGLVHHHEDFIYKIEGRYTRQAVSSQHDVVLWGQKVKAAQLLGQTIKESAIAVCGNSLEQTGEIEPDWLRLLVWVVCDGCIVNLKKYDPATTKARVQFKLSKPRKIERLRALLDRMQVRYTFAPCKKSGINKLQPYYIRLYGDEAREIARRLDGKKQFPREWVNLPNTSFNTFVEELSVTDGTPRYQHFSWHTTSSSDADIVQEWGARCGWVVAQKPYENVSGFANGKPQWRVVLSEKLRMAQNLKISKEPYGRLVYCLTMPMGTVVTRLGGKVAFTGNCERLWHLESSATGVLRDYARDGIKQFESLVKRSKATMLPYDARLGVFRLGHMKVVHGYFAGLGSARRHAITYGNCLFGHTHATDSAPVENADGPAEARGIGCCCKIDMSYNQHMPGKLRHNNAWCYGFLFDDGTYQLFQAKKLNGRFYAATAIQEL